MNYTHNAYGEDHWNGQQSYQPPPSNHHQYHNYYSPTNPTLNVEQNSQFHQQQNPSNSHDHNHNPNSSPIFHTPSSQYIPQFIPPTNIKSTPSPSNSTPAKQFQEIDPDEIDQFVIEQRLELEYEKVKSSSLSSNLSSTMSKNDGQLVRESDWMKQCVKKQKKRQLDLDLDLDEQQESSVNFDDLTTKLEVKLLYYMTLGLTEVEIVVLMVNDLGVSTNSKVEKMIGKLIDRDHPVAVDWYLKNQLIQAYRHRAQGLIGDEMKEQRQLRTKEVSASRRERSKTASDDHTKKEKKNQDNSRYLSNMVSSVIQTGKDALNSLIGNDDDDDDEQTSDSDDDKKNKKSSSRAGEKKETKASSKPTVKASKVDLDQLQDTDDLKAMKVWFKRSKNGYQLHATGQLNGIGSEDIVLRDANYQWIIEYVCKGDVKNTPEYIRGTVDSVVKNNNQVFLGMKYESSL